jgi:chromate transporter
MDGDESGAAMKSDGGTLAALAGYFALMSLFAIGGANSAVPEMHRLAVDVKHWMTDRQFTDLFALAQVTPGPNVIIVTLIGYHVAGILGALVTTVAMCGPTCLLAFFVSRVFDRYSGTAWQAAIRGGLVPVTIGLTAASAAVVARAADTNWIAAGISLGSAVVCYRLRLHPLWVFAAAALIGLVGIA